MSHPLTIEVNDVTYQALQRQARAAAQSLAEVAAAALEEQFGARQGMLPAEPATGDAEMQAARQRFEQHFGAVDLGCPTGVDNEGIDADLARAYADQHEPT